MKLSGKQATADHGAGNGAVSVAGEPGEPKLTELSRDIAVKHRKDSRHDAEQSAGQVGGSSRKTVWSAPQRHST